MSPGTFDLHFAYEDGSVRRFDRVPAGAGDPAAADRFNRLPHFHRESNEEGAWQIIPER